jgi:hypothetical protein
MAARKKKPWNADLQIPGYGSEPEHPKPKPFPDTISPSHSIPGGPVTEPSPTEPTSPASPAQERQPDPPGERRDS